MGRVWARREHLWALALAAMVAMLPQLYGALAVGSVERREWISSLINQTLLAALLPEVRDSVSFNRSCVVEKCFSIAGQENAGRLACCSSAAVKHIYNALFENNKLVLFEDEPARLPAALPPILSFKMRQEYKFNMPIEVRRESFDPTRHCRRYFDGTLHVMKRSTAHNIYHSTSDNFMVLVAGIILDAYLAPSMLHKPRQLLVDYHPTLFNAPGASGFSDAEWGAPHMRLLRDVMSDGIVSPKTLDGTCYRRVVWGSEPHSNYLAALQTLRRQVASFARLLALSLAKQTVGVAGLSTARWFESSKTPPMTSLRRGGEPLKVVLYTRGGSGRGRSIANELLLVQALQARGAAVFYCCDFGKTALEDQLLVATEADVIVGLHGAAIVHGLFMRPGTISLELKTLYAYESILFFLIADSRAGVHGQVDIRKYFLASDGHRPVDDALVARVMAALTAALRLQAEPSCKPAEQLTQLAAAGDFVTAAQCPEPAFAHILGPLMNESYSVCTRMSVVRIMTEKLRHEENKRLHCSACGIDKRRLAVNSTGAGTESWGWPYGSVELV